MLTEIVNHFLLMAPSFTSEDSLHLHYTPIKQGFPKVVNIDPQESIQLSIIVFVIVG